MDLCQEFFDAFVNIIFLTAAEHRQKIAVDHCTVQFVKSFPEYGYTARYGVYDVVESADLISLVVFCCDVIKTADESDDTAVVINRAFTCDDVSLAAFCKAFAMNAAGCTAVQNKDFIVFKRIRVAVPAHVFIGLPQQFFF